ncbi:MAG: hypothetical protein AAFX94_15205 [Myxococcota bacterium]
MTISGTGGNQAVGFAEAATVVDAHWREAGDFVESRTIGDDEVFLTSAGALAFDSLVNQGFEAVVMSERTIRDNGLFSFSFLPWRAELEDNPELVGVDQQHSGRTY